MNTLRIIERQLQQSKPVAGHSLDASLRGLQAFMDTEIAAAVQKALQTQVGEIDRLKALVRQAQDQVSAAQAEARTERERLPSSLMSQRTTYDTAMQAQQAQAAQAVRNAEAQGARERDAATQTLRAELNQECKARIQAEAKLAALQETHAAFVQTMKAMKPSVTHSVKEVQVKSKPLSHAFEIRRRGDGLIAEVIVRPIA